MGKPCLPVQIQPCCQPPPTILEDPSENNPAARREPVYYNIVTIIIIVSTATSVWDVDPHCYARSILWWRSCGNNSLSISTSRIPPSSANTYVVSLAMFTRAGKPGRRLAISAPRQFHRQKVLRSNRGYLCFYPSRPSYPPCMLLLEHTEKMCSKVRGATNCDRSWSLWIFRSDLVSVETLKPNGPNNNIGVNQ